MSGRKPRLPVGEWRPAGARASCGCWRRVGRAARCVPVGSRQAVENAGLGLLWDWAKPGCVGVARVALGRVLVGSAASRRRIAIHMYGLSCGMLSATMPPFSHSSLASVVHIIWYGHRDARAAVCWSVAAHQGHVLLQITLVVACGGMSPDMAAGARS